MPTGLVAMAQSGKTQLRATSQVSSSWSETYPILKATDVTQAAFLATIQSFWRNQVIFQCDHRSRRTLLGAGGSALTIATANQTGSSIAVAGTGTISALLRAGDIVLLPGLTLVYEITSDFNLASGTGNLQISPPVFAGNSPTNSGSVTTNATPGSVTYRARVSAFSPPAADANSFYGGMSVTISEMP